jgi:DNA repair protein RadD
MAPELRDYQLEAIELCVKETERAAYVVLPTGAGKSLVMARVAMREEMRVLILVPLVALLDQMLEVLAANMSTHVAAVGGAYEHDSTKVDAARVVVCVYNSAHKLDATKFDRVLIDEAHFARAPAIYADLLDGDTESEDEEEVSPSAGPSHRRGRGYAAVRAAMALASARLFSATLDVPDGAERCTRTLREMIDDDRLCDYRLNVPVFDVGATNTDLARFLVRSYRSMLIYCATRTEGVAFCAAMNELGPCARYIDCETGRRERSEVLAAFRSGGLAFVVNVRVLSVGFDAPITKGVCFVNMPASKTHIVQVIGRCLRVHPGKMCAQVVLPLVAGPDGEDKRARDFMRVLAQNDAMVAGALRAHRGAPYLSVQRVRRETSEDGEQTPADILYTAVYDAAGAAITDAWSTRYDELVAFCEANGRMPPTSTAGIGKWVSHQRAARAMMSQERKAKLEALRFWAWDALDDAWSTRYDELVAFYEENGCMPPTSTAGLGPWVSTQRKTLATMPHERKERLTALRFWTWDPLDEAWSARFAELVAFCEANGRMPSVKTAGLGPWVNRQRLARATMPQERKAKLEALRFWAWDPLDDAWSTRYDELLAFCEANGRMPSVKTAGLGPWVQTQRQTLATMPQERKAKLEALRFWAWDPLDDAWSARYDELLAFCEANGRMPPTSGVARAAGLGPWVQTQRQTRATMPQERKAKLEALRFWAWDPLDEAWSMKLAELVAFYEANGIMPPRGAENGLGEWVSNQRRTLATMPQERREQLEALRFWAWDPLDEAWSAKFAELVAFHDANGRMPPYSAAGLGKWVSHQRAARSTMPQERKEKLEALPFWVWDGR